MHLNHMRSVMLVGAMAATAVFAGPTVAADKSLTEHCESLAMQFKTADVSHLSPDKLEATRRQAAHGERLCKTEPQTGVKALDLAFKDIGITPK
jgi:hypothetical protein